MSGREFEFIRRWLLPLAQPEPALADLQSAVKVGNGDDALVVSPPAPLVMSMDLARAGTHFPSEAPPEAIAAKALRAALSDLAAMGARPWFYTLGLVLPKETGSEWWQRFSDTLLEENHRWQVQCLGGDLTAGDTVTLSVQVHGLCERPLTRTAASPGQDLWVTGTLGGSAAGLPGALGDATVDPQLVEAFYRPELPLVFMERVNALACAAIDISDGLVADLEHVLAASDVGAALNLDELPLHPALCDDATSAMEHALYGGEDYQVLFSATPEVAAAIVSLGAELNQPVQRIGRIEPSPGVRATRKGRSFSVRQLQTGYSHFD